MRDLDEIRLELRLLREQHDELLRRYDALAAATATCSADGAEARSSDAVASVAAGRFGRRLVLGGAVAGIAGMAGVLGGGDRAAAADPLSIDNGRANTADRQTTLVNSAGTPPTASDSTQALTETDHLLLLDNSASTRPTGGGLRVIGRGNAISATATGPGSAIEIRTTAAGGTGITAFADGAGGVGAVISGSDTGVRAGGTAIAGLFTGGAYGIAIGGGRPLVFTGGHGAVGPPSTMGRVGETAFDLEGSLFLCVAEGTSSGGWRKLAGPTTAGSLHLLPQPRRVYDSRPGAAPVGPSNGGPKGAMADQEIRVVDATANGAPVPRDARGLLFNLAVTATNVAGYLTAWGDGTQPLASSMNWSSVSTTVSNSVTIALGSNATFQLFCGGGGAAHVIVDVAGYYR